MESTSIYAALAAVQSELKAPKGQMNTFGGYRYRSCEDILEAVKPILKAHDLLLTLSDEPKVLEGWHYIEATAKLESLDGGCISVKAYAREPEQKTKMDAAQVTGTSSSYARKYALNGLFCIDDHQRHCRRVGQAHLVGVRPDRQPRWNGQQCRHHRHRVRRCFCGGISLQRQRNEP